MSFINSNKISKKVIAIAMCAMTVASRGAVSASAKNTDYSFSVAAGKLDRKYWAVKDDDEQLAYINAKKVNGNFKMYAVTKSGTKVTESRVVKKPGKKTYEYFKYTGRGVTRGVCAYNDGNSKGTVSGVWCP